ncbi:hypothetical protein MTR67_030518 [Solanum verrucosum]|uniref:Retrotransposon gag domain-containing protein n=1 Tax=Solanum verrucosum TaxID=315347 RepID=A0AAF0U128_SOLVR|nr:hypothetical protein MTR67_030518 [Solanum verrucosum]
MGVTPVEKAKLATYQHKGVAQIWFNQWKEARPEDAGPLEWERFKCAFLDKFFPLEMREAKLRVHSVSPPPLVLGGSMVCFPPLVVTSL